MRYLGKCYFREKNYDETFITSNSTRLAGGLFNRSEAKKEFSIISCFFGRFWFIIENFRKENGSAVVF